LGNGRERELVAFSCDSGVHHCDIFVFLLLVPFFFLFLYVLEIKIGEWRPK
jgi:hypothetical protein